MSNVFSALDEEVFPMPPVKFSSLEATADALLSLLSPESLAEPRPLDAWHLINSVLPMHGIHVHSASEVELGQREAATVPIGEKETQILMRANDYEALELGGKRANRPRCTFAHELGHGVMHMQIMRFRKRLTSTLGTAMSRVARSALKPYEDPEWRAYAIGGCILAPRKTILMLSDRSPENLARVYEISESMALNHLRRLKLLPQAA